MKCDISHEGHRLGLFGQFRRKIFSRDAQRDRSHISRRSDSNGQIFLSCHRTLVGSVENVEGAAVVVSDGKTKGCGGSRRTDHEVAIGIFSDSSLKQKRGLACFESLKRSGIVMEGG